jgi:dienelactone hydrolase
MSLASLPARLRTPAALFGLLLAATAAACSDDPASDNTPTDTSPADVHDATAPDDRATDAEPSDDTHADTANDPDDSDENGDSDAADPDAFVPEALPLNGVDQQIPACAPYAERGPWLPGHTTIELADGIYDVFYPSSLTTPPAQPRSVYDMRDWLPETDRATIPDEAAPFFTLDAWRDLPAAQGEDFPLLVFSHGLAGYRLQSATLLAHVASWGFVVASPDHPERYLPRILERLAPANADSTLIIRALLDDLLARNAATDDPLSQSFDPTRIAMSGHSAGGGTTLAVAGFEEFDTLILYGAGSSRAPDPLPTQSLLIIGGETDGIIPIASTLATYEFFGPLRRYISIRDAGHLAFSDICVVGRDAGGILSIAAEYGIRVNPLLASLGRDGCNEGDLEAERSWPIIHHTTVAHLRDVFGIDETPVGLDADVETCFGELIAESLWDNGE